MGSTSVASVAASGVLVAAPGVMWQFSIFIGNRCKQKTIDIWRCANEEQCVPDKTGCSCRTTTQGVRLARHVGQAHLCNKSRTAKYPPRCQYSLGGHDWIYCSDWDIMTRMFDDPWLYVSHVRGGHAIKEHGRSSHDHPIQLQCVPITGSPQSKAMILPSILDIYNLWPLLLT